MAATAKDYAPLKMHQGPGDLWYIPTAPVDATPRLTLTTGTPDATAHPGSIHLGAIAEGITTGLTAKQEAIRADNFPGPLDYIVLEEEMKIEATLKQAQDLALLQYALTHGTYSTNSGYKQLTFGGKAVLAPSYCFAAISPTKADAAKYIVALVFRGVVIPGASLVMSRGKPMECKLEIVALYDPTSARTPGKSMGIVYCTE